MTITFESLPNELWVEVFKYLPTVERRDARRVCQRFKEVIDQNTHYIQQNLSRDQLLNDRYPYTVRFAISPLSEDYTTVERMSFLPKKQEYLANILVEVTDKVRVYSKTSSRKILSQFEIPDCKFSHWYNNTLVCVDQENRLRKWTLHGDEIHLNQRIVFKDTTRFYAYEQLLFYNLAYRKCMLNLDTIDHARLYFNVVRVENQSLIVEGNGCFKRLIRNDEYERRQIRRKNFLSLVSMIAVIVAIVGGYFFKRIRDRDDDDKPYIVCFSLLSIFTFIVASIPFMNLISGSDLHESIDVRKRVYQLQKGQSQFS